MYIDILHFIPKASSLAKALLAVGGFCFCWAYMSHQHIPLVSISMRQEACAKRKPYLAVRLTGQLNTNNQGSANT